MSRYVIAAYSKNEKGVYRLDENGNKLKLYYAIYNTDFEHPSNFVLSLKDAKKFEFVSDKKCETKKKSVAKLFHDDPDDYFIVKLKPKKL